VSHLTNKDSVPQRERITYRVNPTFSVLYNRNRRNSTGEGDPGGSDPSYS